MVAYKVPVNGAELIVNGLPDNCPYCHKSIIPILIYGLRLDKAFDVFMICPNSPCRKTFIAHYRYGHPGNPPVFANSTTQGTVFGKTFSDTVNNISEAFSTIYNQAFAAEQQGLLEICGVGYRKALEFLIKDYAITIKPADKDKIEKTLLGGVIEKYVNDIRIKSVAKRAAWLGNDETHYVRKWEGKDLQDLKKLIDLTVHWIEMEVLTASFELDMPE